MNDFIKEKRIIFSFFEITIIEHIIKNNMKIKLLFNVNLFDFLKQISNIIK